METPKPERLQAPEGYGIGRGDSAPGELLPWSRVEEWLQASRNYWVCTTRPDGRAHAKPVWGVWLEGMVLFSTDSDSVTGRNLRRDPRVLIHLESGDDVAILEGEAQPLGENLFDPYADAYDVKYHYRPEPSAESPPWSLQPHKALTWSEADFPQSATRWTF
jgi:hypothetical protein